MTKTKERMLFQIFNKWSSIPFLKPILVGGWFFTLINRGLSFVVAYYHGSWGKYDAVTTKALLIFISGQAIIAYFLVLWYKYEKEKSSSE